MDRRVVGQGARGADPDLLQRIGSGAAGDIAAWFDRTHLDWPLALKIAAHRFGHVGPETREKFAFVGQILRARRVGRRKGMIEVLGLGDYGKRRPG